jgi:hypothetical protein
MTEFQLTCPLGSKCEEIRDNKAYRCAWYTKLVGKNPQTGADVDEHACAIAWLPVLQIENTRSGHSTAAAVESLRNVVAETPVQQIRLC